MNIFCDKDHKYFVDGRRVVGVTEAIGLSGCGPDFSCVNPELLEWKSKLGTAVHLACRLHDEGKLDDASVDENVRPYLKAWQDFRNKVGVADLLRETPIFKSAHEFCGTPDRIVLWQNRCHAVLEIKTVTGVDDATGLQMAGYEILARQHFALSAFKPINRLVVQLRPDGKWSIHTFTDTNDRQAFLNCLGVAQWKLTHRENK